MRPAVALLRSSEKQQWPAEEKAGASFPWTNRTPSAEGVSCGLGLSCQGKAPPDQRAFAALPEDSVQ